MKKNLKVYQVNFKVKGRRGQYLGERGYVLPASSAEEAKTNFKNWIKQLRYSDDEIQIINAEKVTE